MGTDCIRIDSAARFRRIDYFISYEFSISWHQVSRLVVPFSVPFSVPACYVTLLLPFFLSSLSFALCPLSLSLVPACYVTSYLPFFPFYLLLPLPLPFSSFYFTFCSCMLRYAILASFLPSLFPFFCPCVLPYVILAFSFFSSLPPPLVSSSSPFAFLFIPYLCPPCCSFDTPRLCFPTAYHV
jgi:hypothetical protein